ncbi:MAG: zinc metallopeptidase [Planctomycetota bacterium]
MPFFFFDPTMILLLPAMLIAIWAQVRMQSTFARYARVASASGYTGARAARRILDAAGATDVDIQPVPGTLTDHYDPRSRVLALSQDVYAGRSLSSLGVAAHEAGHALQHSFGYLPLGIRSGLVPVAKLGYGLAFVLFFIGFFFRSMALMNVGIYLFVGYVAFTLVTLPVEFNASKRAIALLTDQGIVSQAEAVHARKVLRAAALTYVAAALTAIMLLLRFLVLRGSRQ